jgi:hypothetical protein
MAVSSLSPGAINKAKKQSSTAPGADAQSLPIIGCAGPASCGLFAILAFREALLGQLDVFNGAHHVVCKAAGQPRELD